MERLKGLTREYAVILVMSVRSTLQGQGGDPTADLIARLMVKNKLNLKELTDISLFCGEEGLKTYRRAIDRYKRDPSVRGTAEMAENLLLRGLENQVAAEDVGKEYSDEQVQQDVENAADQYADMMRTREWLRDEFNIESRQDYAWMMQALRITFKSDRAKWLKGDRAGLNALTREAFKLYRQAKSYPCSPRTLTDWRKTRSQPMNPHAVYRRPDGVEVWGSGELVIRDKNGAPKRPMDTIFGLKMPEGSVPMDFEMDKLVDQAYPKNEPPKPDEKKDDDEPNPPSPFVVRR